jgi:hypothetical protein
MVEAADSSAPGLMTGKSLILVKSTTAAAQPVRRIAMPSRKIMRRERFNFLFNLLAKSCSSYLTIY